MGIPVRGTNPTLAAMLSKVCDVSHTVIPAARSFPCLSGAFIEIRSPLQRKSIQEKIIIAPPSSPSSSRITAKMESVKAVFSTRYPNLCLDCPNPFPRSPPYPIPINICCIWYPEPLGSATSPVNARARNVCTLLSL